ncbi:corrinoid protein [Methanosarcina sp. 2.H.T.1A.6]|uniref:cobalamin B12-binding domain-containing protein n=1 Tax=unclassified Methanosarcina TaxID=2644672 RepID=UPI0006213782|nr:MULTISPECIES: cobalamin-dependent protein [unclassified Methanosarcina]KKG10616.1 corrinoid protein [Methanosarcina sp. 2.H.T.1A.15]KKG18043.1 corrinoid protein [Methanosarcina sp. 2.H.T.1A.3]KKG19993.1 corrinoid protein [Methanosarcina sp. 2.H.T.1A.6]KKG22657.1 corrinoid protein [Methanosarcina sp. 2.H.T.1A.8]
MYRKNWNLLGLLILGMIVYQFVFPVSAGDSCRQENESVGTVIIATVEGDSHTFGKDSIATAFEKEGFEVINLGDSISAESLAATAKEKEADFVFSSASMSTTMLHQIQIEEQLKAAGIRDKVITGVGGSLVTQAWADKIGADIYAAGPEDAVFKAKSTLLNGSIPGTHISANESTSCGNCHR